MKNKGNLTQKFIILMLTLAIFSIIPQYHDAGVKRVF